ncbi:LysR substrate-binding domain-containing protein [Brucella sp. C7-11G]
MRFELRHLRCFIAAAEQRSIRRAARTLSVEPSTVSRRIRDLEDDIGVALFIRGHGGIKLTQAGERFLPRARKALRHLNHASWDVATVGRGRAGVIKIGLMSSIASGFIAELVDAFATEHRDVHIDYTEGEASEHVPAVRHHRLDIAFLTGAPKADGCEMAHLWNERVYVAMAADHELATKVELTWNDLIDRRFIISEAQSGTEIGDYLVKNLAQLGYHPNIQAQAVYRDTLMQIVAKGEVLTLTSEATIAAHFPGIVYRPLAGEILPFYGVWAPRNEALVHQSPVSFRVFIALAFNVLVR